jgi:diaminohydroxyphosphoribosylaminopyrimidine deaminase/5-amino-6-(5-phosphoribosylamino)uracil reductase
MHRCIQLAQLANGYVAPNPMVGSVLVDEDRIIGEGYHQQYGGPHAEVNCIASVKEEHQHLVSRSTLYVSLEPCAHFGKTPPCADLIIEKKIRKVVVGCRDPFEEVNGKGIEKLRAAGVEVVVGVLEEQCKQLNKRFFTFHVKKRPYVILKWAETGGGKIARLPQLKQDANNNTAALQSGISAVENPLLESRTTRLLISNSFSNRLVHKWRSEEMAIVVGTNTALYDDPQLGTRLWPGKHPIRIIVDMNLRLPSSLQVFDGSIATIVFNKHRHSLPFEKVDAQKLTGVNYYQVTEDVNLVHQLLNGLYSLGIQSILVEGGAQLLQSFIDEGLWDEARVISNEQLTIGHGLPAPQLAHFHLMQSQSIASDFIRLYQPTGHKI